MTVEESLAVFSREQRYLRSQSLVGNKVEYGFSFF